MKLRQFLFASAFAAACVGTVAQAESITFFTDQLTANSTTELGRASRSGVPQTWLTNESYTGQVNTAITYYYKLYDFAAFNFNGAPYVDISVNDENNTARFFVSAFAGSYDPSDPGANWLGDMGQSGNITFYPNTLGNPADFQVILPPGKDLVLLVNSTAGGTVGLDQPYDIAINAYADTQFNDPIPAVPEPGTLVMTLTGFLGTVGLARRRLFAK
jgi:hypothetical protein